MLHPVLLTVLACGTATSLLLLALGVLPLNTYWSPVLAAYATAEAIWAVYYFHMRTVLSSYKPKAPDLQNKVDFIKRMVAYATGKSFWQRWLAGSKETDEVHKENIIDLVSYNIYNKDAEHLTETERDEISRIIEIGAKTQGFEFAQGKLDHVSPIKHTRDPVDAIFHPWILYAMSGASQSLAGILHRLMGFQRRTITINRHTVNYWYCKGTMYEQNPIVVCHGVGVGLLPYMNFVYKLYQKKHPIICVEFPHIALTPIHRVISNDELAEAIEMILSKHHYERATFVGHSFGTFIVARFLFRFPERVEASVFLDPVCFQLFMPDVVCKFLYDKPASLFDYVRFYLITKNLHMNYVLRRHFWWYQLNLWRENLPEKSFVVLSEKDEIVPVNTVYQYLTEGLTNPDEKCVILPSHGHARWLANDTLCRDFSDVVISLARAPFVPKKDDDAAPVF